MQYCMNNIVINEVLKFSAPVPGNNTCATQFNNSFDAILSIISPLQISSIIIYFNARKPASEEFEHEDIPTIDYMMTAPPWVPSSIEISQMA